MDEEEIRKRALRQQRFADSTPPPKPKRSFAHPGGEVRSNAKEAVLKFNERMDRRRRDAQQQPGVRSSAGSYGHKKHSNLGAGSHDRSNGPGKNAGSRSVNGGARNARRPAGSKDASAGKVKVKVVTNDAARAAFDSIKTLPQRLKAIAVGTEAVNALSKKLTSSDGSRPSVAPSLNEFLAMLATAEQLRVEQETVLLEGHVGSDTPEAGKLVHDAGRALANFFHAAAQLRAEQTSEGKSVSTSNSTSNSTTATTGTQQTEPAPSKTPSPGQQQNQAQQSTENNNAPANDDTVESKVETSALSKADPTTSAPAAVPKLSAPAKKLNAGASSWSPPSKTSSVSAKSLQAGPVISEDPSKATQYQRQTLSQQLPPQQSQSAMFPSQMYHGTGAPANMQMYVPRQQSFGQHFGIPRDAQGYIRQAAYPQSHTQPHYMGQPQSQQPPQQQQAPMSDRR